MRILTRNVHIRRAFNNTSRPTLKGGTLMDPEEFDKSLFLETPSQLFPGFESHTGLLRADDKSSQDSGNKSQKWNRSSIDFNATVC
jgi:hypothetical protein